MPGPLITGRDINTAAVSFQKRNFNQPTGKARQVRVWFTFTAANTGYPMPHALGRVPTSFHVAASGGADAAGGATLTAPGIIYSASALPGQALNATRNYIVLASTAANTWAEIILQ